MPTALQAAEAEWLAQLATMRKAIQELRLDQNFTVSNSFEDDYSITDDELLRSGGDDIWDITDDEDEYDDYSSDSLEQPDGVPANGSKTTYFNRDWLNITLSYLAATSSGFPTGIEETIVALLASDSHGA